MRSFLLTAALAALLCCLSPAPARAAGDIVNPYQTYTYEQLLADIHSLEAAYPHLVSAYTIGQTSQGRDIPAFIFGQGKREMILVGSMHGREHITTNFIMDMVDRYAQGYENNRTYQGLSYRQALDDTRFIIIPMSNPDGVSLSQFGLASVRDPERVAAIPITANNEFGYAAWKANANGVDINRNFPYRWSPSSTAPTPASYEYRGPYPASEAETKALLNTVDAAPFYMLVSLHTMGQVIYWADSDYTARREQHRTIAQRFADSFNYRLLPVEDISSFGGYLVNYARNTYGRFCMTVEMCPMRDQAPDPIEYYDQDLSRLYSLGLIMATESVKMPALAAPIDVRLDGRLIPFPDQRPLLRHNRTLVPLRAVLERCGLKVDWDGKARQVRASREDIEILLTIDQPSMLVNGEEVGLDVAPCLINGRAMLPLRAVLEACGFRVDWDGASRTVLVSS